MKYEDEKWTRTMKDKAIIARLLKYAKPFSSTFIICAVIMFIIVGLDTLSLLIKKEIIGNLGLANPNLITIYTFIIVFAISAIIISVGAYISGMMVQRAGQGMVYNVRQEIFAHVNNLSIAQINSMPVGKLVTRVTNDTGALSEMFTNVFVNLAKNIFSLALAIVIMFFLDVRIALTAIAIIPVLAIVSYIFRFFSRKAYRNVRSHVSNMNAFLSENLSGMKITQIYNQEEKKLKEFEVRNNELEKSSLKEMFVFAIFRPSIYVLYVITMIIVFAVGGNLALLGKLGEGAVACAVIFAFYDNIGKFFNPIQQIAEQINTLQSAFASCEKIFSILDIKPDILNKSEVIEMNEVKGEIEFKNVWFAYKPDQWILKDVSFLVSARQTVAFVGATGAGKTTILQLLVRNYEIQKGEILIDGINIRDISLDSLRRNIGQMLQDVFLFSGTVESNITLRDETITQEEIVQACKYVNADTFINKLENQYLEPVKERGNNFSAGQRQLLSFARTIVHKPKIMILDEATANIDTETEMLIQDSLLKMKNIGTMLIVAHRLSTIQHSDNIIVLQKGEIIEQGNHQKLLKKKGYYYNLYKLQYEKKK